MSKHLAAAWIINESSASYLAGLQAPALLTNHANDILTAIEASLTDVKARLGLFKVLCCGSPTLRLNPASYRDFSKDTKDRSYPALVAQMRRLALT